MMLMSWGGERAADSNVAETELKVYNLRSLKAIEAWGVYHGDERDANLLWNNECRGVIVIDFDRAILQELLKHRQLSVISGVKKRRKVKV